MDNRRLIDADKLLEWLRGRDELSLRYEMGHGVFTLFDVESRIIDGKFDADPIPPTIKPGDRVLHGIHGMGTVTTDEILYVMVKYDNYSSLMVSLIKDLEVIYHD